jgi:hypothetical protein
MIHACHTKAERDRWILINACDGRVKREDDEVKSKFILFYVLYSVQR